MSDEIEWTEEGGVQRARWRSEAGAPPPRKVLLADDRTRADVAFHQICEGAAYLYRGDHQNARQLLTALAKRVNAKRPELGDDLPRAFHLHRQAQGREHQLLSRLLIPLDAGYAIPLSRAPEVGEACTAAWGVCDGPSVVSLRELLGVIGAHEWRKKGVQIAALGAKIHPHYGVFSPVRGEYVELVAKAPLADVRRAFDVGTGSGVLALVLAKRGVPEIIATDSEPRAVACARDNVERLGQSARIQIVEADLFPEGRADLIVCNPPWLPARPTAPLERAIYDPEHGLLRRFLAGLEAHLEPEGEAWLILSDLAELLGLRARGLLDELFASAGLTVQETLQTRPSHRKSLDADDPLHSARAKEITTLYRLRRTAPR